MVEVKNQIEKTAGKLFTKSLNFHLLTKKLKNLLIELKRETLLPSSKIDFHVI